MAVGTGNPAAITPDAWPVAEIPTPPVANHPAGVLIPLRWAMHGDLRILVDELDVFVSADDLLDLAELIGPRAYDVHPTLRPDVTWSKSPGEPLLHLFPLADALAVLDHAPTHQTLELREWLREQLPLVLRDEVIDRAIGLEGFLDAYTVSQAALILDRDPGISIGQRSLFQHLEHIGWADRDLVGHWRPTRHATRHGYLTIREVLIRPRVRAIAAYPQIYVTPAGLAELRHTLHALNPDPPEFTAPETLPIPD